jgi:Right handed beta helix region
MKQTNLAALSAFGVVLLGLAMAQRDLGGNLPMSLQAADFLVTSARDAGPETLRDAILAADRLSSRARIRVIAEHISIESALPPLTNPRGVEIDARAGSGTIDADRSPTGSVLQVNSPGSSLRGLRILHAHGSAIIVDAPGAQLDSITVTDGKIGILLAPAAEGCTIRAATFERNETGVMAEPGVHDVTIVGGKFRANTHAGFWFVSATNAGDGHEETANGPPVRERVRLIDDDFVQNATAVVLANQPTLVQKSRFTGSRESAVLVLGGGARVEDNDIRGSGGAAVSVTTGHGVRVVHNVLTENAATAIMERDSDITIERNVLTHNGTGIVAITNQDTFTPVIRNNTITGIRGDGIVVIGGTVLLQGNQVLENHGAGLRALDLVAAHNTLKATARLDANTFKDNGINVPVGGVYKVPDSP